jgi:hypothetical protein
MFEIKAEISMLVHHEQEYQYWVTFIDDNEYSLTYQDGEIKTKIFFGSLEEMEAVAKVMLKLTDLLKK